MWTDSALSRTRMSSCLTAARNLRFGEPSRALIEFPFPNGIEHETMLLAQLLFFLRVPELDFGRLAGIRRGLFAHAAAAHENLRLQQTFAFTRFTLHVVDGVAMLHIGIEAKNHRDFFTERLSD